MRRCQAFNFGGAAALLGLEAKRSLDLGLRLLEGSNRVESTVSDPPEFIYFLSLVLLKTGAGRYPPYAPGPLRIRRRLPIGRRVDQCFQKAGRPWRR
jgi:hypothetical protein